MGTKRAIMGTLSQGRVKTLFESALEHQWAGALRIKTASNHGTVWLIRGHAVHAECNPDNTVLEGMAALEEMFLWAEGSYLLDCNILPPCRTIRLPMNDILSAISVMTEQTSAKQTMYVPETLRAKLDEILSQIRGHVPELKSLSIVDRDDITVTSSREHDEDNWIDRQLNSFDFDAISGRETVYIERDGRTLFVLRQDGQTTVLSAAGQAEPKSLRWAAEEAVRRINPVRASAQEQ